MFQALRDDGHPHFHKPDILSIKEYEDWMQHASHIEHFYEIRNRGRTTLQFRKVCTQAV